MIDTVRQAYFQMFVAGFLASTLCGGLMAQDEPAGITAAKASVERANRLMAEDRFRAASEVLRAGADALAKLATTGSSAAIAEQQTLIARTGDKSWRVRAAAGRSLRVLVTRRVAPRGPAVAALLLLTADEDRDVRLRALRELGHLRADEAGARGHSRRRSRAQGVRAPRRPIPPAPSKPERLARAPPRKTSLPRPGCQGRVLPPRHPP